MAPTSCQSSCETVLEGKSAECVTCYFGYSGWKGTTCSCTTSPVLGDLACESCSYQGGSKGCSTDLIDKCSSGSSCQGWVGRDIDDPVCAAKCGFAVDPALSYCQSVCLPPRDNGHPCSSRATEEQIAECTSACRARLAGKPTECMTCYSKYSAWLGETCDCNGAACTGCNWYGNAAGSVKACGPTNCNPTPQCRGFQDKGIDGPECASLCGVPVRDAGADASFDAGMDGGQKDASVDGG